MGDRRRGRDGGRVRTRQPGGSGRGRVVGSCTRPIVVADSERRCWIASRRARWNASPTRSTGDSTTPRTRATRRRLGCSRQRTPARSPLLAHGHRGGGTDRGGSAAGRDRDRRRGDRRPSRDPRRRRRGVRGSLGYAPTTLDHWVEEYASGPSFDPTLWLLAREDGTRSARSPRTSSVIAAGWPSSASFRRIAAAVWRRRCSDGPSRRSPIAASDA